MVELAHRFRTQSIMVLNRGVSGERAVDMRTVADGDFRGDREPTAFHLDQKFAPARRTSG